MSEAGPSAAASVNIQVDTPESAVEVEISSEQPQRVRNRVRTQAGQTTDDGGAAASRMSQTSPLGPAFLSERRGTFEKFLKRLSLFDAYTNLRTFTQNADDLAGKVEVDKLLKDGYHAFAAKYGHKSCNLPSQVIKFKDITYKAEVVVAEKQFPTVGSVFLDLLPCFRKRRLKKRFHILDNCSGYLMPGTFTLICGPPGCGKTSLHKALSGKLVVEKGSTYSGTVTYNGKDIKHVLFNRVATYIGQIDRHYPTLTVRETCQFAYDCTNIKSTEMLIAGLEGVKKQLSLEIVLRMLAMSHVADSMVGDEFVRGLSGGERHRVTFVEMVADSYKAMFLDEVSNGQDSSASQHILTSLLANARERQTACLLSVLQPSPEVFELADRLIVLAEGRIIYQGPREDVLPYFAGLGYVKPPHVDAADFLQEVATPDGKLFLEPGFRHLDTESFVKAYKSSDLHKDVMRVVNDTKVRQVVWCRAEKPLGLKLHDREGDAGGKNMVEICEVEPTGNVSKLHWKNQTSKVKEGDVITGVPGKNGMLQYIAGADCVCFAADVRKKVSTVEGPVLLQLERVKEEEGRKELEDEFVQDWWLSTRTVLARQSKLLSRNKSVILARLLQVLVAGVVTGTLFYQLPPGPDRSAMDLRRSLSFMSCLAMAVATISQIPSIIAERKVFEKQYAARFFRPSTYVIATTVAQFPYFVAEIIVYCPLLYWLTGLSSAQHGVHFLMFMLLVFESSLIGAALTRFSASICRTTETAMALAGITIIISIMFTGFTVTKNKIPYWWIWAYYLNPLQYGVTGLVCNEFLSGKYNQPCTSPVPYCDGRMDMTIGQAFLDLYDMPINYFNGVWASVIAIMVFYVTFTGMTFWSVAHLRFDEVKLPSGARLLGLTGQRKESPHLENTLSPRSLPSIMEFEPFLLSFHQISYEVVIRGIKEPKVLLNGVSGYAKPGTMTALMGSSGAGKTTLLDVLAGRKTTGKIRGDILLNGFPKQQETFARVSGYVEQNNIHQPFVTVNEALEFSAALRLPRSTTASQRKAFVKEVTDLLELEDIRNKLVGSIGDSGLSVEEAKRLTIGVELVANPSIIFFDEPTTGLDSRSAQIVIRGIKKIVQSGRSAICTIHQPSSRLFLAFDQLLMLKKGGEVCYFGKIGPDARDLLGYFHGLPGITKRCGPNQNPATYLVDLIIGERVAQSEHRDFGAEYQGSILRTTNWQELERVRYGKGTLGPEPTRRGYAASFYTMMSTVLARQFRSYWRNVDYNCLRLASAFVLGILLGSSFWQIKYDNTPGLVSRSGLIYISISLITTMTANSIVPQLNAERPVYYREMASNMYSSLVYSLAWALAEAVYLAATTLIFCGICFSMAGVSTDSAHKFIKIWYFFLVYTCCITFFGLSVAMMTPNAQTASVIVPNIINCWNMAAGLLIAKKNIPRFWVWLYWFNPTQFVLNGASTLAFHCDTTTPQCRSCSLNTSTGACPSCDCVHVQDQDGLLAWLIVSTQQSLDYSVVSAQMGILNAFAIFFFVGGLAALRFMGFNKR